MKKAVVLLVIVSLVAPALASAGNNEHEVCESPFGLGQNACCVYNCFQEAEIIGAWSDVLTECFSLNSGDSLSTSSTDGTREAEGGNPFGLGDNAWCVWWFSSSFWFNFSGCIQHICFHSNSEP
jgi:hypothetical protein